MTSAVRKRQQLTGMRYDRVDLVPDGANEHADILIAKNRGTQPTVLRVTKAMGSIRCNNCGTMNGKNASVCKKCHSTNLEKTRVDVTKTVVNPRTKKVPKNDDATNSTSNASGYTFEDQQYDQDNGENGQALGDAVERSQMTKSNGGWFPIRKDDVDDVDNEKREKMVEGEDPDDDIEELAETKPTGGRPDRRTGYKNTSNGAEDTTGNVFKSRTRAFKAKRLRKTAVEVPGRNSWDYGDQGSQEVAESAEQMYRAESQPTRAAQERRESTLSDALTKARRRRSNREGLDVLDNGNSGIYQRSGVKRNGTNTGQRKTTNQRRTAVAPPGNPLDRGKTSGPVAKGTVALSTLEALNLSVGLAENLGIILKANRPDLYETAVDEFLGNLDAFAGVWFSGEGTVTKSKFAEQQVDEVAERVNAILHKASPESEMSDKTSAGEDADDVDSKRPKVYSKKSMNAGEDESRVGKKKVYKSVRGRDPYAGLSPEVVAKMKQLDDFLELKTQEEYLAKARTLRGLPGFNEETVAKQLRTAYEADEEMGESLYTTLQASANAVKDSPVFKQFGLPGMGTDTTDDPMGRATAWAKSQISKANDGQTIEQLRVQYMREHPAEFYEPAKQLQ